MYKIVCLALLIMVAGLVVSGCGKVDGPRFWWDDRNQEKLSDSYQLPDDPGAPAESGFEHKSDPVGSDLSDNALQDYQTNPDRREERRKSESSLVDF